MTQRIYRVKHLKTGNIYTVLAEAVECTNGREDLHYIIYTNGDMLFCREKKEFSVKFQKI